MHDVWVLGAFDARDSKPARGAWLCPSLGVYSVTKKSKAVDMNDGLRIGCAMAILSALNSLGENLTIHLPKYPAPRWVINPNHAVPLPNLMYRLLYKAEVHPRIESKSIKMVPSDSPFFEGQLHALLTRGEVPKECML